MEELRRGTFNFVLANTPKGSPKPEAPKPIPYPGRPEPAPSSKPGGGMFMGIVRSLAAGGTVPEDLE